MKYAFYTLGCKVNQYETQAMQQLLLQRGDTLGDFDGICDCYVINTCTVTAMSDKKSRNAIRRVRRRNPEAVIGVCGCYAQHWEHVEDAGLPRRFEQLPAGGLAERTRALLKVEDGCNNFCTYCIIPYARGRVRSLPLESAVQEARKLAAEGYREIVVNGIEISSWGWEWHDGSCLRQLLTALCAAVPEVRIRLGSLEPRTIDEEFCRALSGFQNLCPQFHLSLQSGSDPVLKRMNRKYDTARYYESVRLLNEYFPGCAVTTDLIVGFPGESEASFEESLAFIRKCALTKVHIFPYSRREGTPADKMPDQVPKAVKEARAARAAAVAAELEDAFHSALIGTVQEVLFEQPEDGLYAGHAPNYAKVYVRSDEALRNRTCRVRITEPCREGVLGELV